MKLEKRHLLRILLLFYYLVQHAPGQDFGSIFRAKCMLAIKKLTVKSQSTHISRHLSPELTITSPQALPHTQERQGGGSDPHQGLPITQMRPTWKQS